MDSDVEGFDQNCPKQGWARSIEVKVIGRARTATETSFTTQWWMRITNGDIMEIQLGLRPHERASDHAYCHNHPRSQPGGQETAASAELVR